MKFGLCLAGGGIKGAAHIGAIKAFEEENIDFEVVAGTSSGSIVGTLYAAGYSAEEMYELFKKYCTEISKIDWLNIMKLIYGIIFRGKIIIKGFNNGEKIKKIINKYCKIKNIENINEIKKTLIIPSVNLEDGGVYIFSSKENRNTYNDMYKYIYSGNIGKIVQSSCSYPGVFSPCKMDNAELIDGGIRENVPWREIKKNNVSKIINIIFEKEISKEDKCKNKNIIDIITGSVNIMTHELSNYELEGADFLLKIQTKKVSLLDTREVDYLYNLGYETAKKNINEIKNYLYI